VTVTSNSSFDSATRGDKPKNKHHRRHLPPLETSVVTKYEGHVNIMTISKSVGFLDPDGKYVVSGSDDGAIFVWDTESGELVTIVADADPVFNHRIAAHPTRPLLATIGSESRIRFVSPVGLTERIMPKETKDKIVEENLKRLAEQAFAHNTSFSIVRLPTSLGMRAAAAAAAAVASASAPNETRQATSPQQDQQQASADAPGGGGGGSTGQQQDGGEDGGGPGAAGFSMCPMQ
jgi:hypothetical protein